MLSAGSVPFRHPWVRPLLSGRCRTICYTAVARQPFGKRPPRPKENPPLDPRDKWNYNVSSFDHRPDLKVAEYDFVTANTLESAKEPPKKVRMLTRDYIEDSLYNPHYGYFTKQATIFNTDDSRIDFSGVKDVAHFQELVASKYAAYGADKHDGPGRQLWHTPTELFKPWYGRAIAQCLVAEYLLKCFPYEDFIIYEIGAGNGTLALDILNYVRDEYPDVYERTRYNIIEISPTLAQLQKQRLSKAHPCVKITNQSIFHWNKRETSPCYFLAMEVVDNFAHDIVRYDLRALEPYQGVVSVDEQGDFDIHYTPVTDPLIKDYLDIRQELRHPSPVNRVLRSSDVLRKMYLSLPFAPNLSQTEFIPTRLLSLLKTLRNYFPRHRLLLSDFDTLPDTIPGVNAPVVQTRVRNVTVPCTTLFVRQGYFDIFFPTNFEQLRDMYEHIISRGPGSSMLYSDNCDTIRTTPLTNTSTSLSFGSDFFSSSRVSSRRNPLDGINSASGLPVGERKSSVFSHAEFMETYAELDRTRLHSGENPIVDFYKNVKFLF